MSREEFDSVRWGAGMSCYINGELHEIVKVDFEEYTIGVMSPNGETIIDFPCEFVTINERGGAR